METNQTHQTVKKAFRVRFPVEPRIVHDCEDCEFVGQLEGYDLYVCKACTDGDGVEYVIRFGREPQDYRCSTRAFPGTAYALIKALYEHKAPPAYYETAERNL